MSFSNIRKFVITMKELGYPKLISMESFRRPNFELVAHCLQWLILRYDPTLDLEIDTSTEVSRTNFLRAATHLMLAKANIKLNPKHLYSADGYAVKELLKIASLLQLATISAISTKKGESYEVVGLVAKPFNVKIARVLVNEITKCGTALYDILDTEPKFQEARNKTIMKDTSVDEIEHNLHDAISSMLTHINLKNQEIEDVEKLEKTLQFKCEKRKFELECAEKRLQTLQNVRPTYTDKYEEFQGHLHNLSLEYVEKHQNLQWLETQIESHSREEQEKMDAIHRRMRHLQRSVQNEELCILRGEDVENRDVQNNGDSSEESEVEDANNPNWFPIEPQKTHEFGTIRNTGNDKDYNKVNANMSNWEAYRVDKNTRGQNKLRKILSDDEKEGENLWVTSYEDEDKMTLASPQDSIDKSLDSKEAEERNDEMLDVDATDNDTSSDDDF